LEGLLRKNEAEWKMRLTTLVVVVGALLVVYGAGRDELEGGGHGPEGVLHYEDLDKLYGGDGNDVLKDRRANSDHDELRGGEGNDIVNAYDCDVLDIVVCGFGTDDTAIFDADSAAGSDSVSDSCENKVPR
jgi:Ca2+-binding RTX toxin-like protein